MGKIDKESEKEKEGEKEGEREKEKNKLFMLSVVTLNGIILNVTVLSSVAPVGDAA